MSAKEAAEKHCGKEGLPHRFHRRPRSGKRGRPCYIIYGYIGRGRYGAGCGRK